MDKIIKNKVVKGLLLPLAILLLWLLSGPGSYILPSPQKVIQTFIALLLNGKLFFHIYASLVRVLSGFILALSLSFFVILCLYFFPKLRPYVQPILNVLRHIPPLAVLSLLILWLGIGEPPKIAIVFMASFFPLMMNIESGILYCDPKLIEVGFIARFTPKNIFFRIVLPAAMPSVIAGMNIGLSYAWRSLIGAELVAASSGLGYMILDARELSRPDIILVGILSLGLVGAAIDSFFIFLTKKLPYLNRGAACE